ncbi:MAG TPA: DUF362 domain-containing protein [Spirochaetota bacterium]|nr:DUF362 domain-containing protein [Spirochaetota bacterium]
MPMTRVSIYSCAEYDERVLNEIFIRALDDVGFKAEDFRGARVALKPNMLNASAPEKAVVTHPAFFAAAVRMVKDHGGVPVLVESPAFQSLEKVAAKTGYDRIIAEERIEVWDNRSVAVIANNSGRKFKRFEVAKTLLEADVLLNLPKIKTHAITCLTCAVKNLFGTIPGKAKSQWHMRAKTREEFPEFILDFYGAIKGLFGDGRRIIHLVDGIVGMEGEGPGPGGTPRRLDMVIAGTDAVAVDRVVAHLTGMDVSKIVTISSAVTRGLGAGNLEDIEIAGQSPEDMTVRDFKAPGRSFSSRLQDGVLKFNAVKNLCVERPVPSAERCTLCYQCNSICPAGAIDKAEGAARVPRYDYDMCIRCYCCMEICPEAAITLKKGKLQWIMDRL